MGELDWLAVEIIDGMSPNHLHSSITSKILLILTTFWVQFYIFGQASKSNGFNKCRMTDDGPFSLRGNTRLDGWMCVLTVDTAAPTGFPSLGANGKYTKIFDLINQSTLQCCHCSAIWCCWLQLILWSNTMEHLIVDCIVHLTNEYILMIILLMKVRCRIVETPWAGRVTRAGRHGRGKLS